MDSRFTQFIKEHEASLKKLNALFNFVGYVKLGLFSYVNRVWIFCFD